MSEACTPVTVETTGRSRPSISKAVSWSWRRMAAVALQLMSMRVTALSPLITLGAACSTRSLAASFSPILRRHPVCMAIDAVWRKTLSCLRASSPYSRAIDNDLS